MPPITSLSQCAPRYRRAKPIAATTMPDTRYGHTRRRRAARARSAWRRSRR
jgi:hypothetical protein